MHLWLFALLLPGLFSLTLAQAGTLTEHRFQARGYPGSQDRAYQVYVPDGLEMGPGLGPEGQAAEHQASPAPLVMVLHGCSQTSTDVRRDWGMQAAADRYRFILVTPSITRWDGLRGPNCWGFWLPQHRQRGQGEPEDLYQIAREVEQRHPIDPQRRYVTGLSSGGAMTAILAVTHNDYWAAVATVAGLPYGEDATAVSVLGVCPGWALFHP
ncbi:MAG TPA: PHB depolymerase family esterase, partial [Chromatiaceae bacterium]|nr:PHB depolymerase family esterase [Chromatiaceae bacterium]